MIKLTGKINITEGQLVMVSITDADAERALILLDALQCNRIKAFSIEDKPQSLSIAANNDLFCVKADNGITFYISNDQLDLLRCCCLDQIFQHYIRPHVDLECGKFELTFSIHSTSELNGLDSNNTKAWFWK